MKKYKTIKRINMFETNSSSVNVLCFDENWIFNNDYNFINIPKTIYNIIEAGKYSDNVIFLNDVFSYTIIKYLNNLGVNIKVPDKYDSIEKFYFDFDFKFKNIDFSKYENEDGEIVLTMQDTLIYYSCDLFDKNNDNKLIIKYLDAYHIDYFNIDEFYNFITKSHLFFLLIYTLSNVSSVIIYDTYDYNIDQNNLLNIDYVMEGIVYEYAAKKYLNKDEIIKYDVLKFIKRYIIEDDKLFELFLDKLFEIDISKINTIDKLIDEFNIIHKLFAISRL